MKGKNFKKEKVNSHLERSPPHSHLAHVSAHVWTGHTQSTDTPSQPETLAYTQTPHTSTHLTHARARKGVGTTKEVEEKCYP